MPIYIPASPIPSPSASPSPSPAPEPTPMPKHETGDIIQFGGHNWRILDMQGNHALIITENVISHRTYHHTLEDVTWETSEIRQYLNNTFLGTFSEAERARIRETTVVNSNNPWDWPDWGGHASTFGGNNTADRIFLLSIDEVLQYFGDSGLVAEGATVSASARGGSTLPLLGLFGWGIWENNHYSEARIARDSADSASWWWLRSPGLLPNLAAHVGVDGCLSLRGTDAFQSGGVGGGVRPALWLSLEP